MGSRRTAVTLTLVAALVGACTQGSGDAATSSTAATTTTILAATTTSSGSATTLRPCTPVVEGVGDEILPASGNPGYDVEAYDVDLRVAISSLVSATRFEATTTITARALTDLPQFNLDFDTLAATGIEVDGRPARSCPAGSELTIVPASPIRAGATFTATISYGGRPLAGSDGTPAVSGWHTSEEGIALFAEPAAAHSWLPSNDHPSDAARFTVSIEVPDGYAAVGPGTLRSRTYTEGGVRYRWVMDHPIPTYLVPLVVDRLERLELDEAIPTEVWSNADPTPALDELSVTDEAIALLESWFGPYPFERSGAVLFTSTDDLSAALETTPTITYDARIVNTVGPRLVVHELAHMWAGNSVRLERWRDIWLKEGLATFAEFLWMEADRGEERYRAELERARGRIAFEQLPPMGDPGTPEYLYTSRTYLQGGLVFATLRTRFGDEALRTLLQTWFERYAGRAAGTDDFVALTREIVGDEAAAVVEDFVTADGVPAALTGLDG